MTAYLALYQSFRLLSTPLVCRCLALEKSLPILLSCPFSLTQSTTTSWVGLLLCHFRHRCTYWRWGRLIWQKKMILLFSMDKGRVITPSFGLNSLRSQFIPVLFLVVQRSPTHSSCIDSRIKSSWFAFFLSATRCNVISFHIRKCPWHLYIIRAAFLTFAWSNQLGLLLCFYHQVLFLFILITNLSILISCAMQYLKGLTRKIKGKTFPKEIQLGVSQLKGFIPPTQSAG